MRQFGNQQGDAGIFNQRGIISLHPRGFQQLGNHAFVNIAVLPQIERRKVEAKNFDAADQAGISRIWGGIHVPVDDFAGRKAGSQCGKGVWAAVQKYFNGSVLRPQVVLSLRTLDEGLAQVSYKTQRGLYYKLQSSSALDEPFVDQSAGGFSLALDASVAVTNDMSSTRRFYRVVSSPVP